MNPTEYHYSRNILPVKGNSELAPELVLDDILVQLMGDGTILEQGNRRHLPRKAEIISGNPRHSGGQGLKKPVNPATTSYTRPGQAVERRYEEAGMLGASERKNEAYS
jgi:hypothetical protein